MAENTANICPNCQHQNHELFNFCENCGQKNRPIKITFYDFIKDFLDVVFNLDNRFWRTIKSLFIPGKLTKIFYSGKRKSFYHPLRLYIVGVIFLFAVLSFFKIDNVINIGGQVNFKERYQKKQLLSSQSDAILSTIDSLKFIYKDKKSIDLLDTVANTLFLVDGSDTTFLQHSNFKDSSNFSLFFNKIKLTKDEMYIDTIDHVIARQGLDSFLDRLALKQLLKGSRDFKSFNAYLFANLTWLLLAIVPVFSLILKLFYIRRNRFYMEHFVFLLHLFTAMIFILSIILLILLPTGNQKFIGIPAAIIGIFFPFLAFKNYYGQGVFKTFFKFCAIGFFFLIGFILTFAVFLILSAVLF